MVTKWSPLPIKEGGTDGTTPKSARRALGISEGVSSDNFVSVKDFPFGAVGDGVIDDTAAIQAAINSLNTLGGGTVIFPDGSYKVGAITMRAGVSLVGQSRAKTILQGDGDLFALGVQPNFLSVENITVQNITTRGKLFTCTAGAGGAVNRVTFRNVTFKKATYHIYSADTLIGWQYYDCDFQDASVCSRFFFGCWAMTEYGVNCHDNAGIGMKLEGSTLGSSTNSSFGSIYETNGDSGIVLSQNNTNETDGFVFNGCHFENNGGTTNAADVQLVTSAAGRIRAVRFNSSDFFAPTAGQTVRVSITEGGGGTIDGVRFSGGCCTGTVQLVTDSNRVTVDPDVYLPTVSIRDTNLTGLTATYKYRLRRLNNQGAPVASANNLSLGSDGNFFHITASTQINLIDSTGWLGGDIVTIFFDGTPTVKHNFASSGAFLKIILRAGADLAAGVNTTLTLRFDSTNSLWAQV